MKTLMMEILGVGVDLVWIPRFTRASRRWGARFQNRIFTQGELAHARRRRDPFPHLAGLFAVKESLLKALGWGFRRGVRWTEIEVYHQGSGQPAVRVSGAVARALETLGADHILVSISHDGDYAMAQVLLSRKPPSSNHPWKIPGRPP